MNKEQPPTIDKEKEPTLEDIKGYFKEELDFYSSKVKFEQEERLPAGVRDLYNQRLKEVRDSIEGFEKGDYEKSLEYIELTIGEEPRATKEFQHKLDLVSKKLYEENKWGKIDKDIRIKERVEKKIYLREMAEKLISTIYPERKLERIGIEKIKELLKHGEEFCEESHPEAEKHHQRGDYKDVLDYIDFEVAKLLKKRNKYLEEGKEQDTGGTNQLIDGFRRYRTYFIQKEESIKKEI